MTETEREEIVDLAKPHRCTHLQCWNVDLCLSLILRHDWSPNEKVSFCVDSLLPGVGLRVILAAWWGSLVGAPGAVGWVRASDSPCLLEFFVFPPGGVASTGLIQNTQTSCSTTPAATVSKAPPPPHMRFHHHTCLHDDRFTHLSPWLPPCMLVSLTMAQHRPASLAHPPT